ncbi:TPA: sel1 repeat family protein, partial [bacterium]|nr:sel1 repeat family protein [bacterium]
LNGYGVKKDHKKAVDLLLNNLQETNYIARYNLSMCYATGIGVEKNIETAITYLKEASEGDEVSMYYLGLCYLNGNLVEKDLEKGYLWLERAIRNGCIPALASFADYYFENERYRRAIKWYKRAYKLGLKEAGSDLALAYLLIGKRKKALAILIQNQTDTRSFELLNLCRKYKINKNLK